MVFTHYILNPPYGNLHLKILEKVLGFSVSSVVCLHPARWLEDPLWMYKRNTDREAYQKTIVDLISSVDLINPISNNNSFDIGHNGDLMISSFNERKGSISLFSPIAKRCLGKILGKINDTVDKHCDENRIDGCRCKVNAMLPSATNGHRRGQSHRIKSVEMVDFYTECVYENGKLENGSDWTESKGKSTFSHKVGEKIPLSIKFDTLEQARNFRDSCREKFYRNWLYLVKFDMHTPLFVCPYMGDYSRKWSDDDYCQFFSLDEKESEFMKRDIYDYRIKDFMNYISL